MKSELYSQNSIQAVLDRLDGPGFLQQAGLSNGDFVQNDKQIKSYCPICQDRSKMTLILDNETRRGHCINLSCQGSNLNTEEGNLVELYALAKSVSTDVALMQLGNALGIPLTRKELKSPSGETILRQFEFVEVSHFTAGEDGELKPAAIHFAGRDSQDGRGIVIQETQVEEFAQKYRNDVFRSHFVYNTDNKEDIDSAAEQGKLYLLGDYYVVFNATSSAEIVHAINQAIDLVERLKQGYTIPYEAVYVYYTNRNIEVCVDRAVFSIEATLNLQEVFRRMTCAVIGVDPLKSQKSTAFSQIDLSVYRHDFMTAIPGSVVTSGTREIFKIRMSYSAFKKMSYQRLHEFSLRRPEIVAREVWTEPSEDAVAFFTTVKNSIESDTRLDERDTIASLFYRTAESDAEISTLKQLAPTLLRRLFDENRQLLLTPSPHLDQALSGGMYPGHLYIVSGAPGSGTSTMVLQMMNHAAANQKAQCIFVGLQRGVEELFKRSLSYLGKIPVWEIDEKRQSPQQLYEDKDFHRRIFASFERYQTFADHITILEGAAAGNLNRLVQILRDKKDEIRQKSARSGSVLLVIDSLQLMVAMIRAMRPERGTEMELTEEGLAWSVETLTSRLKAVARELDVTVLATLEHQLPHRGITTDRSDSDPAMQQLIFDTQFADTVMLLSRQGASTLNLRDFFKTHYTDTPLENRLDGITSRLLELEKAYKQTQEFQALRSEFAVLDILKNRNGPRDKILLISHKPFSYFEPLEYLAPQDQLNTSPLANAET